MAEVIPHFWHLTDSEFLMVVLNLLDMLMVATLIKMIVSGSYQTFVEKVPNNHTEKTTSGALKIKMGASLVGVSSINLLQTFIDPSTVTLRDIAVKCGIHIIFLISTLGLAYIEYLHDLGKSLVKCELRDDGDPKTNCGPHHEYEHESHLKNEVTQ